MLFERPYSYGAGITIANYDVTSDGQRFLMVKDEDDVSRLRVVLDWRPDAARVPSHRVTRRLGITSHTVESRPGDLFARPLDPPAGGP